MTLYFNTTQKIVLVTYYFYDVYFYKVTEKWYNQYTILINEERDIFIYVNNWLYWWRILIMN